MHVLSCNPRYPNGTFVDDDGVSIHRRGRSILRSGGGARWTRQRISAARAVQLELKCLETNFDIIESPDWLAEGLFARKGRSGHVVHAHAPLKLIGPLLNSPKNLDWRVGSLMEKWSARKANLVTTPSSLLADYLIADRWGERVEVIPYPVDSEPWGEASSASSSPPTVLVVGRLDALKSPELVVLASAQLRHKVADLRVRFVGRSNGIRAGLPYAVWLQNLARSNRVNGEIVGELDQTSLAREYENCRVVVVPSRFESFSMAAAEGMASGRPVICTDNTGIAPFVQESGGGCVFPTGSVEELVTAMARYLLYPEIAAEAGGKGRTSIGEYSPDRVAKLREKAYESVS